MAVVAGRSVASGRPVSDVPSGRNNADVSQREDLANFISMITRDETPFMSSIGKAKATAIYHEWQTDELDAPGDSRLAEGADYITPGQTAGQGVNPSSPAADYGSAVNPIGAHRTRLGNYCQINGKTLAVSGTRRAIDQAGVADEYAYQLKKRGTELRRDIEFDLIHSWNVASGSSRRTAAGFQSFISDPDTVVYAGGWTAAAAPPAAGGSGYGTGTAQGVRGLSSGTGDPGNGALSLSDIDQVMQNIYEEGGKASRIMLSPKLRRDFSDLMVTDSGVRRNLDEKGKLRQSVDVYMSDFGDLMVVPNYIMGLSHNVQFQSSQNTPANLSATTDVADFSALVYDPQWFSMVTLRPLQEIDVAQRGDSTIGMMLEEWSFECKNPKGCGAIYGLE